MRTKVGANSLVLANNFMKLKAVRMILAVFLFLVSIPVEIARSLLRLVWYLLLLFLLVVGLAIPAILVNTHYLTNYSISQNERGAYQHDQDPASTAITNYLTTGDLTKQDRIVLARLYIKNMYEKAGMQVPADIMTYEMDQLNDLVLRWQVETSTDSSLDPALLKTIFMTAEESPLSDKALQSKAYTQIWATLRDDAGAPKIRWMEEQGEFVSWLVAASSSEGDKQYFYDPINHTIFLRYGDSFQSLLDEAAHAVQFRNEPVKSYGRLALEMSRSLLCAVKDLPSRAQQYYKASYDDPRAIEGEAHIVIKPALLQKRNLAEVEKEAERKPIPEHRRAARLPQEALEEEGLSLCRPPSEDA